LERMIPCHPGPAGIALACDTEGRVLEILSDQLGVADHFRQDRVKASTAPQRGASCWSLAKKVRWGLAPCNRIPPRRSLARRCFSRQCGSPWDYGPPGVSTDAFRRPESQAQPQQPPRPRLGDARDGRVGEGNYRLRRYVARRNHHYYTCGCGVEANQAVVRKCGDVNQSGSGLSEFRDRG
jgi:hypothetical protein